MVEPACGKDLQFRRGIVRVSCRFERRRRNHGTGTVSKQTSDDAFAEKSEVPISAGLYYLAFLLVATLSMLLIAGGVIG